MLVFIDLTLDLRVGNLRGAFVEQAWACHDNDAFGVYFDKFPDEGWAFHEGSGHSSVVVSHSSSRLKKKLELALGRVGILAEDFPEFFFCWLVSWLA